MNSPARRPLPTQMVIVTALVTLAITLLSGCGGDAPAAGGGADGTKTDTPQTAAVRKDKGLK